MTAFGKLCLLAALSCAAATMRTTNVAQFGDMIHCLTDRSHIDSFLDYEGYGCWCGLGGAGTPLDDTDMCCKVHDNCYDTASNLCPFHDFIYGVFYIYSGTNCKGSDASVTCAGLGAYTGFFLGAFKECAVAICECDRVAAECFAASNFDESLKDWDKDSC